MINCFQVPNQNAYFFEVAFLFLTFVFVKSGFSNGRRPQKILSSTKKSIKHFSKHSLVFTVKAKTVEKPIFFLSLNRSKQMLPIFYAINKFPHLKQYLEKQETACKCKKFKKYKKIDIPYKACVVCTLGQSCRFFFRLTTQEPLLSVCIYAKY